MLQKINSPDPAKQFVSAHLLISYGTYILIICRGSFTKKSIYFLATNFLCGNQQRAKNLTFSDSQLNDERLAAGDIVFVFFFTDLLIPSKIFKRETNIVVLSKNILSSF